ncbi:phenol 2-monooxygenase, partial [Escherichia coli]|nr:phenol 2-monooxygenase [Escherichia coli]
QGASPKYDALIQFLVEDPDSPLRRFTPAGADVDAVFDLRGVHQGSHTETTVADLPALLVPAKGKYGLRDYEKAFASKLVDGGEEIYEVRGIDRVAGALVVVRPDQYVSMVLPLDGTSALTEF